jgi:hypothetical protein
MMRADPDELRGSTRIVEQVEQGLRTVLEL